MYFDYGVLWLVFQAYHFSATKDIRLVCNGYYPEILIIDPSSFEILYTLSSRVTPDWISACCVIRPMKRDGKIKNEPPHDKTNKMIFVPSEDSDQPGHPPSLIRVFAVRMKKHWLFTYPLAHSEDSDQTGQMPRLIWVFVGRTYHFVGFVMRQLIYGLDENIRETDMVGTWW